MSKGEKKKYWNFKAAAREGEGELFIYGDITSWEWDESDTSANSFKRDLDATCQSIALISEQDAEAYRDFVQKWHTFSSAPTALISKLKNNRPAHCRAHSSISAAPRH